MKTTAAVLVETGKPLAVAELEIPALKPGQVLVEIAYSGVCHTQVLECRGYRGEDRYLPHCLGHEGSGIVRDIGPGVTKVKSGAPVILSWMKGSGAEAGGTVYRWGPRNVNAGAITTFSRYSVISENRLTPLEEDISMRDVALLGCAIPTGLGSVFHTAQVKPGQSIAVFGTGGIGLCAVAGAALSGCTPIIAVDVLRDKTVLASRMGATHAVHVSAGVDPVGEVLQICPKGVDVAVEASGRPEVMGQALQSVRQQGGVAVVIGNARHGERVEIDPRQFNLGKQIRGTWGGDNWPDEDFPRYCRLLKHGKFGVEPLVAKIYCLEEIQEAIEDLADGRVSRPLIDMASKR